MLFGGEIMLNQLRIPDQCIIDREINKKEFFDGSKLSLAKFVRSISWYASLKPGFISAKPVRTSEIAYEGDSGFSSRNN